MAWAIQPDLTPATGHVRGTFLAACRAAIVAAVQRLFPTARSAPSTGWGRTQSLADEALLEGSTAVLKCGSTSM
jgi:hypothetical protein